MLRIECLYARQPNEAPDGLVAQKNACHAWSKCAGGKIVREIEETVSPTTPMVDRPAIQDILSDLGCGLFDILLISDSSRLIGNNKDIAALLRILEQNRKPLCIADRQGTIPEGVISADTIPPSLNTASRKEGEN